MQFGGVPQIEAAKVPDNGLLVDVREDDEWVAGHAAGALHVPMSDFAARSGEVSAKAAEGGPVYVVCRSGGRSARVTQYLVQQGLDAVNVDGGMLDWEAAGRPLVSEGTEPAHVR